MKYIWEESDIKPGTKYGGKGNEVWMIGYLSFSSNVERYVSCSMADGMVTTPMSKKDLADTLNENGYVPVLKKEGQP